MDKISTLEVDIQEAGKLSAKHIIWITDDNKIKVVPLYTGQPARQRLRGGGGHKITIAAIIIGAPASLMINMPPRPTEPDFQGSRYDIKNYVLILYRVQHLLWVLLFSFLEPYFTESLIY